MLPVNADADPGTAIATKRGVAISYVRGQRRVHGNAIWMPARDKHWLLGAATSGEAAIC